MPLHPPRAMRWLLGIAGGLLVIAVAGVAAFIATFDVNRLIAPGQARVKAVTGRDLLIRGGTTLEISLQPRLVANDVSISNWPGAGSAPVATAKQVAVQLDLLPLLSGRYEVTRLELVEPVIALATDAQGRGNWEFDAVATPDAAGPRANSSAGVLEALSIDRLDVDKGAITYRDAKSGKVTAIAVDKLSLVMPSPEAAIRVEFRGAVNTIPIDLKGELGALQALAARRWPYPLDVAGKIAGRDTALKAQIRVEQNTTAFDGLDLAYGGRAVKGRVAYTAGGARPRLVADISVDALSAADLDLPGGAAKQGPAVPVPASRFVIPETDVPFDDLREVDADIKVRTGRLSLGDGIVLQEVDARLTLDNGRLEAPVLKANLFGGDLTARLAIDATRAAYPAITVRADARDMDLGQLRALLGIKGDVHGSRVALSIDLKMHGSSPHAWASDATGSALLTISRGTLATGKLDQGGGVLVSLLSAINPFYQTDESTELLCGVARLPLQHGVARIDRSLALETTKVAASASGTVDFRTETLDLSYKPSVRQGITIEVPQVAQLVRLQGSFRDPKVRVDAAASAATAARIGAAIGTGGLSMLGTTLLNQTTEGGAGPCESALGRATLERRDSANGTSAAGTSKESAGKILPRPFRH
jgi:uncharacterized protein involved in outer membrane biogenesis